MITMCAENSNGIAALARPMQLLIAGDDPKGLDLCLRGLRESGINFQAETASTREEFVHKLSELRVDVVLSDYRMRDWTGMDVLAIVKQIRPKVPVILLTGALGDEVAVECMRMGISDYVLKDQMARLPMALLRAQDEKSTREAEARLFEALRESEEHYRTLVQNAPEAIVVLDVNHGKLTDCNEHALWLFHRTREELLRHKIADLSAPKQPDGRDPETAMQEFTEQALKGATPHFEWKYRNSEGEEFPAEVHLVLLPSATRRLIRISISDITERKSSEAALWASEARYRRLVDNAPYGIFWAEEPSGNLIDVNPALANMLGYETTEELLRLQSTKAFYAKPGDRDKVVGQYMKYGRKEDTAEWKRKDGKFITVHLSGRQAMNPDGKSECAEVMVEDITERKGLERQLVQAQKFEAIGQLAGGIAHDFNNMIGAILGWVDLGLDETEPGSRLHRHFEKVRHQAERAAALTRQLLAFARRQILEPRNVDLNQAAIETLSLLEKVIGSNIEIKANLAPNLAVVRADPTQIEQVLMNLCINARDAMPSGGSLIIETSNITLDAAFCSLQPLARPGNYVMLAITDSGTGMDAATLDRIFEPFFTTKGLGKGTGLGLAMVYGIVRQHGGFLHVYSEPVIGSTFRVYLPVSTAGMPAPELVEDTGPVTGGAETILVAEDHDGLRALAHETLTGLGYKVLLAADGQQALQEFERCPELDLALLDVVLPKLSGPEVYARLQEVNPNLPVIFATGYSPDLDLLQRVQQQGLPVLQKPYSSKDLLRKVRQTLDSRAHVAHD
jgi:two-component system, cell cycle sensor histidine kinase and response regulator CckA